MKRPMAIRLARNPILATLLLLAFFARALVPAGFMPGPDGLILCHGFTPASGAVTQPMAHDMSSMDMAGMDMSGTGHHGDYPFHNGGSRHHAGSLVCPFAAAATTMANGHTAVLAVSVAAEAGSIQLPDQPFVPRVTIVPTRLPRGPPSLA